MQLEEPVKTPEPVRRGAWNFVLHKNHLAMKRPYPDVRSISIRRAIHIITTPLLLLSAIPLAAQQAPGIDWQRCYGGTNADQRGSIVRAAGGGYVVAGATESTNGDVVGHLGDSDAWVLRIAEDGTMLWQRCLGGSAYDGVASIVATADGGVVMAGMSNSPDGDVGGVLGALDIWLVRLDASGNTLWSHTYGGSGMEEPNRVRSTADGGFIIAAFTYSDDGDIALQQGLFDAWLLKVDANGVLEWQRTYGGSSGDLARDVIETTDGGYAFIGASWSNDGDVSGNHGQYDAWVVKVDTAGAIQWQRAYGGTAWDDGTAIVQCADGGYAFTGQVESNNGDISGNHGLNDAWLVRLDDAGNVLWQRCLGGSSYDGAWSLVQTADNGFAVGAVTLSNNGDVSGNHGSSDIWLVRVDPAGSIVWQRAYGGTQAEEGAMLLPDTGDGYVFTATTYSNNGDVSGNHGERDIWVVKLDAVETGIAELVFPAEASLFPDPTDDLTTLRLTLHTSAAVEVDLLSGLGQVIDPLVRARHQVGMHTLEWSMRDRPAGLYLVRVRVGDHVRVIRLIRK